MGSTSKSVHIDKNHKKSLIEQIFITDEEMYYLELA